MKHLILVIGSLAGPLLLGHRVERLRTANASAEEILKSLGLSAEASPETIEAARIKLIDAANPAATSSLKDELGLGPLQLPAGIEQKDVSWRMKAGLALKQAVQAALGQKRHDDAVGKAKAAKARKPQVPSSALADLSLDKLFEHASSLKGFDAKSAAKLDKVALLKAIDDYNVNLAKEERAAS